VKVRTRLVLFGALAPVALLVLAILVAGWLFRRDQLADVERRLLAQAAVESVGMFDGPDGAPHVHLPRSPLAAAVQDFAPQSALYDASGALVSGGDAPTRVPARVPLTGVVGAVRIGEQTVAGIAQRTLELPVRAPNGNLYTLWLGASLAPVEATMARFYGATLSAVGALALVLLSIQVVVARRLAQRIEVMTSFLPRLRDGDTTLPADPGRDELAALRDVLREVAVRLAEARAEQDRLLASAAHELRTPLTVLRTEVDLALRKQRSNDELREALREVRDDVDRLGKLAGALLDLQAVRHLGFDRTSGDLGALVREASAGLRTVAEARRIELAIHADAEAPARFDERALRQAVDNLLGNALKHAPAGSTVDLRVTRQTTGWQIAVSDHGPGVPASEAERIFEPFQRAAPGVGAGLGLAIVREVAHRHGGRAWLDTSYADGARFVLEIAS
jgi:signal transduction histidine kinase